MWSTAGIAYGDWRQALPKTIGRTLTPEPEPGPGPEPEPEPEFSVPAWLLWPLVFAGIVLLIALTYRIRKDKTRKAQPETINTGEALLSKQKSSQIIRRVTAFSSSMHTSDDTENGSVTITLDCIGGPAAGNSYPFNLDQIMIGSDETIGNELYVKEDEHMSATHERINISVGHLDVTDLNATNGTMINGTTLDSGSTSPIHSGEQLRMGLSIFEIYTSSTKPDTDEHGTEGS